MSFIAVLSFKKIPMRLFVSLFKIMPQTRKGKFDGNAKWKRITAHVADLRYRHRAPVAAGAMIKYPLALPDGDKLRRAVRAGRHGGRGKCLRGRAMHFAQAR